MQSNWEILGRQRSLKFGAAHHISTLSSEARAHTLLAELFLETKVARQTLVAFFVPVQLSPQHFLYFLPDPHGHGSFLPTFPEGAAAA